MHNYNRLYYFDESVNLLSIATYVDLGILEHKDGQLINPIQQGIANSNLYTGYTMQLAVSIF